MSMILHIEASPRGGRSISSALAEGFVKRCLELRPGDSFRRLELWKLTLPEFDADTISAKFKAADGQGHTREEAVAWSAVKEVFNDFSDADKYVFSVPMWNFGIPYKLKHFIDVVAQPGLAFSYDDKEGFKGLLGGRPAVLVAVRGGSYSETPGDPMDFQVKYMKTILGFMGMSDVRVVLAEGVNIGMRDAAVAAAKAELDSIAKDF